MQLNRIGDLKERVLAHKKLYPTKHRGKRFEYAALKDNILDRVQKLEDMDRKKMKYLRDIDEYLAKLKKRLDIDIWADPDKKPEKPAGEKPAAKPEPPKEEKPGGIPSGAGTEQKPPEQKTEEKAKQNGEGKP